MGPRGTSLLLAWLSLAAAGCEAPTTPTAPVATTLAFTVQPSTSTSGAPMTPAVQVAAQDAAGNTVVSFAGDVTLAIGNDPAGGTLGGTATVAVVNGVAAFSNLSIDKAGSGYTLTAAASGLTGATSTAFDVTPGVPANVTVSPANPTLVLLGATQQMAATAKDAADNTVSGVAFTWTSRTPAVATVSASGLVTAVADGTTRLWPQPPTVRRTASPSR